MTDGPFGSGYEETWRSKEMKEWIDSVLNDMAPKMRDSALIVQLVPQDGGDVKFWVELGASIMLNKPILAVVTSDREIPPKLRQVADEVVVLSDGIDNPAASKDVADAMSRILKTSDA